MQYSRWWRMVGSLLLRFFISAARTDADREVEGKTLLACRPFFLILAELSGIKRTWLITCLMPSPLNNPVNRGDRES